MVSRLPVEILKKHVVVFFTLFWLLPIANFHLVICYDLDGLLNIDNTYFEEMVGPSISH